MSTRPLIYPLSSIEPLRTLVGSNDASLIDAIVDAFMASHREDYGGPPPDADSIEEIRVAATAIASAKLPLDAEPGEWEYVLRYAAKALGLSKSLYPINEDWKWMAWTEYRDEVGNRLPGAAGQQLGWLVDGRPLVGSRLESRGSYYAWLEPSEVQSLLAALEKLRDTDGELDEEIDEFHVALVDWLHQCEQRALLLTAS